MATAKIRLKSAETGKIAETVESFGTGFVVFVSIACIGLRLFALLVAVGFAFMLLIAALLFVIGVPVLVAAVTFTIVVVVTAGFVLVALVLLLVAVAFVLVVVSRLLLVIITHLVRCFYRNLFRDLKWNLGAMLFGNIVAIHFRYLNWMF